MRLEHKIAIVTGGGTGIGEAMAKVFAREGAKVAITGRRKDELERVVGDIEQKGGRALALPGSVTNEQDVQQAVAATVRAFGRLDILVNNAGNLFHAARLHETTDQIWDETFDVFMKGPFPIHSRGNSSDAAARRRLDPEYLHSRRAQGHPRI